MKDCPKILSVFCSKIKMEAKTGHAMGMNYI